MASTTSRREFISAGMMLPVAGAGSKLGLLGPESPFAADPAKSAPVKLEYKVLGRTGLKVTTVGMGCMITSDQSVVERALDAGINYFDTARGYQRGNNERMVGAALGAKRKQVVLSTKTHAPDKAGMEQDLERSLRELNTDYIDIWYLHGRSSSADATDEMIEVQQAAKKAGKIRFTGISTHSGQETLLPWMGKKGAFDVVLASYNFTMGPEMTEAVATAAKAGMGVVAMKVMAGGRRRIGPDSQFYEKLSRPGAMLAALKWVVKNPNVATTIPSITDMDQLEENLRAMGNPLSAAEEKMLAAHLEMIKPEYCRMCGKCDGACQKGLPVADVLRYLTYADGYGQFELGRENFATLKAEHAAVRCGDCSECTVACPHGVEVRNRVSRAQELFA
jgi:predicted aldo/keto reductase-like oxidoreductase